MEKQMSEKKEREREGCFMWEKDVRAKGEGVKQRGNFI